MSSGDNVQVIKGAIGPFWAKWDWDEFRGARVFFVVNQTTFRELRNGRFPPNLVKKPSSVSHRGIQTFSKIFTLGAIFPLNLKSKIGQTGTPLRAGYSSRDALQIDIVYSTL